MSDQQFQPDPQQQGLSAVPQTAPTDPSAGSYGPSSGYPSPGVESPQQDAEQEARREEALAKLRQLLTGNIPDDAPIETVNGTIRFGDIPRTEDGNVNETWLDANCTCDEHEAKRIEADKAAGKPYADDEIASGLYL